ncbi:2-oxo acid dehydrogenase subunit E2 [Streptomyces sp. 2A115]|uniref:2-oxo acid dehydrogenase subunit E2 n=1 Tax=Streptomyces sp. 2A115 TaxID=3457439 RepID=UPI003FD568F7
MGTFAVTSLGHRPVEAFHSVGGTTITLGLGAIADRPVLRDGRITVTPVMPLSLTFDHRVIDGTEAADVLAEIEEGLESFKGSGGSRVLTCHGSPDGHVRGIRNTHVAAPALRKPYDRPYTTATNPVFERRFCVPPYSLAGHGLLRRAREP